MDTTEAATTALVRKILSSLRRLTPPDERDFTPEERGHAPDIAEARSRVSRLMGEWRADERPEE